MYNANILEREGGFLVFLFMCVIYFSKINKFSEMVQVLMEYKESYQMLLGHFQLQNQ